MSTKSSQGERPWPSTQQMLLDHLQRIVEGVTLFEDDSGEHWWFGFGDCLISKTWCIDEDDHEFNKRVMDNAAITMFLSNLGVEARDRPSGPVIRKTNPDLLKTLTEIFSDRPSPQEFLRQRVPEVGVGLEEAYAFEMLNKLDQVVGRSKQKAVQEILLLEDVPEGVDDYMAEAAACFRYGFDKACLAVCRTALEEMLKKRIECDHGKRAIQTYDKRRERWVDKNLYTLIEEAHKQYGPKQQWSKYLNDQLAGAAHRIRRWGNGAVHGSSTIPRDEVKSKAQRALLHSKQILEHLWSSV